MSQNDVMNKSVRFHFIPHQHLLQSCVTFWCHKNVKSAVFVHRENRWRHSLIETPSLGWMTLCWVWWFSKVSPSTTFKQSHSITQSHSFVSAWVIPCLWCAPQWGSGHTLMWLVEHSREKKKKSENLLSSTQIWSFSPTKPPPTNFQCVSRYICNDTTNLFTGLLPGSGAAWGRFLSDHQITALGHMHNPAWISFEMIPLADSKFQKLLSGVVSQSAFTGCYLVNHLHPVDLSQRPEEEHSSHFLFPPSLSPPRSPASTVTIAIIRLSWGTWQSLNYGMTAFQNAG